jgi:outer membrane protein assembly factor BamB
VLTGNTLVMVCDQRTNSYAIAVDARRGNIRWKIARGKPDGGFSTPINYSPKDGLRQVLAFGSHTLDAFALDTGERLWWVGRRGERGSAR